MEIILSILQVLGIVFLILIGIILLILLVILFVPIRYKIHGKVEDNIYVKGNASWFLHLFRIRFAYENGSSDVDATILWKKINFPKDEKDSREASDKKAKKKSKKKKGNLFQRIKEKVLFIKNKASQIKKLIQDEKNKKAFRHLKKEFVHLIKIILPVKSQLNGIFSTGSPDTTGQLFGFICCFPLIYQDHWTLSPDFESEHSYFKGEFQGIGRIYIFQIVGILLRVIFDKNCRRLYYFINRLGGHNNGRGK